jgi:hypothetical protein
MKRQVAMAVVEAEGALVLMEKRSKANLSKAKTMNVVLPTPSGAAVIPVEKEGETEYQYTVIF